MGEEGGQNWENSKACTFESPHTNFDDDFLKFISRGLIVAKSQKIRKN